MKTLEKDYRGKKRIKKCQLEGQLSVVIPYAERIIGIVRDIDEEFIHIKTRRNPTSPRYYVKSIPIADLVSVFLKKERITSLGELVGMKATLQFIATPTEVDKLKGEVGFMGEGFTYAINPKRNTMLIALSEYATLECKDPDNGRKKKVEDTDED